MFSPIEASFLTQRRKDAETQSFFLYQKEVIHCLQRALLFGRKISFAALRLCVSALKRNFCLLEHLFFEYTRNAG
jgi:hypothetical protein